MKTLRLLVLVGVMTLSLASAVHAQGDRPTITRVALSPPPPGDGRGGYVATFEGTNLLGMNRLTFIGDDCTPMYFSAAESSTRLIVQISLVRNLYSRAPCMAETFRLQGPGGMAEIPIPAASVESVALTPADDGGRGYVATFTGTNLLGIDGVEIGDFGASMGTASSTRLVVRIESTTHATRFRLMGHGGGAEIPIPAASVESVALTPASEGGGGYVATFTGTNLLGIYGVRSSNDRDEQMQDFSFTTASESSTRLVIRIENTIQATKYRLDGHGGGAEIAIPAASVESVALTPLGDGGRGYVATFTGTNLLGINRLHLLDDHDVVMGDYDASPASGTASSSTRLVVPVMNYAEGTATKFRLRGHGGGAEIAIPAARIESVALTAPTYGGGGYVASFTGTNLLGINRLALLGAYHDEQAVPIDRPEFQSSTGLVVHVLSEGWIEDDPTVTGTRVMHVFGYSADAINRGTATIFRLSGHGGVAEIAIPAAQVESVTLTPPPNDDRVGFVATVTGTDLLGINRLAFTVEDEPYRFYQLVEPFIEAHSSTGLVVRVRYTDGRPVTKIRLDGHGGGAEIAVPPTRVESVALTPPPNDGDGGYVATFTGANLPGSERLRLIDDHGDDVRPFGIGAESDTRLAVRIWSGGPATKFRLDGYGGRAEIAIPAAQVESVELTPQSDGGSGYVATFTGTNLLGINRLHVLDDRGVIIGDHDVSLVSGTAASSTRLVVRVEIAAAATRFRLSGHGGVAEIAIPAAQVVSAALTPPSVGSVALMPANDDRRGYVALFTGINLLEINRLSLLGDRVSPERFFDVLDISAEIGEKRGTRLAARVEDEDVAIAFRLDGPGGEAEIAIPRAQVESVALTLPPSDGFGGYVATFTGTNLLGINRLILVGDGARPEPFVAFSMGSEPRTRILVRVEDDGPATDFQLIGHGGGTKIAIPRAQVEHVALTPASDGRRGYIASFTGTNLLGINQLALIGEGVSPRSFRAVPESSTRLVVRVEDDGPTTKFRLEGHGGGAEIAFPALSALKLPSLSDELARPPLEQTDLKTPPKVAEVEPPPPTPPADEAITEQGGAEMPDITKGDDSPSAEPPSSSGSDTDLIVDMNFTGDAGIELIVEGRYLDPVYNEHQWSNIGGDEVENGERFVRSLHDPDNEGWGSANEYRVAVRYRGTDNPDASTNYTVTIRLRGREVFRKSGRLWRIDDMDEVDENWHSIALVDVAAGTAVPHEFKWE